MRGLDERPGTSELVLGLSVGLVDVSLKCESACSKGEIYRATMTLGVCESMALTSGAAASPSRVSLFNSV